MSELKRNWDNVPKAAKIVLYTILGILGAALLGLLFGHLIRWLWNRLMPSLFGLRTIGFWEGVGLFVLARVLLGGFGGSGGSSDDSKHRKKHKHRAGGKEEGDCEDWSYYDEWWEEDGKAAFHAYAERSRTKPKDEPAPEQDAK